MDERTGRLPDRAPGGADLAAALGPAFALPVRHRLVTPAEDPAIADPMASHASSVWPPFMNEDPVANRLWHHLYEELAPFQACLVDADGAVAASANAAPLCWDGTDGLSAVTARASEPRIWWALYARYALSTPPL